MTIPFAWLMKLGLKERAAKLFGWLVPLALGIALVAVLWGRGERYRADAIEARGALVAQVSEYRATYREAYRRAMMAALVEDARTQRAKEKADASYHARLEGDAMRAAAYAAANRCVRAEGRADPGAAGGADLPGTGAASRQPQGAGDLAELVGITRADLDVCTVNSRRLENAVGWGADYTAGSENR